MATTPYSTADEFPEFISDLACEVSNILEVDDENFRQKVRLNLIEAATKIVNRYYQVLSDERIWDGDIKEVTESFRKACNYSYRTIGGC